jgi:pimeloyl-ACP methyl ester carboxylesterase
MHQRLLFILLIVFISGTAMAQNVMTPNDGDRIYKKTAPAGDTLNPIPAGTGVMQKWIHDPNQNGKSGRITWNQTNFKSYRFNNTSFRLRFPNNYNPANKYPVVIFLHGAGEAAYNNDPDNTATVDRENQDHLFWGAQLFEQRMNQGEWNGFLLFPQLLIASDGAGSQWDDNTFPNVNGILDTLAKYNGADLDRVIAMGLSAGGVGAVTYASDYPKRIASVVASSPKEIETLIPYIETFVQVPIWMSAGGTDTGPDPATSFKSRDSIAAHGANIFFSYYPTESHDTWEEQWVQTDAYSRYILSTYWNGAHKAQPLLYFQNSQFCTGAPISAKMALTPGFAAYEWQVDNGSGFTTIPGATSYIYTATQAGKYQAHFKHNIDSPWSAWSPVPVVISAKKCSADTLYAEHFDEIPVSYIARNSVGGNSSYYYQNFNCQNGEMTNATEVFSQDATGRQGGRFMLNNTISPSSYSACTYTAGDQVWHNLATVVPFTDYLFTFYMANQPNFYNNSTTAAPAYLSAIINGTTLTPTGGVKSSSYGNVSWRKYSYLWNSGNTPNNIADLGIVNNTLDPTWNDFVLDEISLVKYKAPPMPGAAVKNFTLWSKATSINGFDNAKVGLWPNDDFNGNNLLQVSSSLQPVYKNNATDNINFNPVVTFAAASNKLLQIDTGFSGNKVHSAVHAYIVASFSNLAQSNKNILLEPQSGSGTVKVTLNNAALSWTAGVDPANTVSTPNSSIEAGKPTVWSFDKDNNASGAKQDIRKNGIVLGSNNNTATFTGNNSPFNVGNFNPSTGTFDGNIAEVIYLLDSSITPLTQNRIESYLALKYGTSLGNTSSPSNYTASDSTTVFWTANTKYQNDVFGIGTDSASALVQTQSNSVNSGSGNGTGQSAKGNLVLSTPTELLNKRFLMIGNDAGSLSQQPIASGNPIAFGNTRIVRNWKVNNTGGIGAIALTFDTTGLGNQGGGSTVNKYALMISSTGDDTYSGPLTFFTATGASGKKIMFSGVTLNNGAVFTIITNNVNLALPAVWLGFTATAVNGNALLDWKTSDEINVESYTVEHSFNGISFSAIGSVAANNSTGENDYTFTDAGLAPGVHYYRIRRTDKDGKIEYSDIKSLKITTTGANVQVRPNPVVGSTLVLAVSLEQANKTNIQVMSVDGKVIAQQNVNLASGNNLVNINISTVPPGIYLVRVQLSDEVVTKKFIKQHN